MTAIVFGASGGIGQALVEQLCASGRYGQVFAVSRSGAEVSTATPVVADALDEPNLQDTIGLMTEAGPPDLVIVSIGILHDGDGLQPEKSLRHQTRDAFERVFDANTIAPALIAKHMLPRMPRKGPWTFAALSARVGSISDNRLGGWHAYRASKAALNMLIRNYAIECGRQNPDAICVGLHPGTVDTHLSEPFQANVPDEKLFSPAQSAGYLLDVLQGLSPGDSGKVFDWAGKEIAP